MINASWASNAHSASVGGKEEVYNNRSKSCLRIVKSYIDLVDSILSSLYIIFHVMMF